MWFLLVVLICGSSRGQEVRIHDPNWKVHLFASDPEIVTPIGMCVDDRGQVFVIESHTHHPPTDYRGPKGDVIKVFQDQDNDGRADNTRIAAQGFEAAMNLVVSKSGELFVVCAREVWRLEDRDLDGSYEHRVRLIKVHTDNKYAHSCLLGITLGNDGWLYISRGNNGSVAYRIEGTDQSFLEGFGDGGQVIRCRLDGSQLESFAIGFWNPFDIEFDLDGRLFCVDNDPDARGPNRLVHVVQGGDYGYKSAYGGGGNHPFQAWNGELPGTLPFISGTGEAPSGLMDLRRVRTFPDESIGVLTTVWNENTIELHDVGTSGISLKARNTSVWMSGPKDFRPVAIDADLNGNIYITDWVLVDYPNHGRGRIWKLTPVQSFEALSPQSYWKHAGSDRFALGLQDFLSEDSKHGANHYASGLKSKDPFERHLTVMALAASANHEILRDLMKAASAEVRLGALLACQVGGKGNTIPESQWKSWLMDDSDQVVKACLIWMGESNREYLLPLLQPVLSRPGLDSSMLDLVLACEARLNSEVVSGMKTRTQSKANRLIKPVSQERIWSIAENPQFSDYTRALAISMCDLDTAIEKEELLLQWLQNSPSPIQFAVLRLLAPVGGNKVRLHLQGLALNQNTNLSLRLESLHGIARQAILHPSALVPLLKDPEPEIQLAAARVLQPYLHDETVLAAMKERLAIEKANEKTTSFLEQLTFNLTGLGEKSNAGIPDRPHSFHDWSQRVGQGGSDTAGKYVFHSMRAGCIQCHTIHRQGGLLGPDLSNLGQSVDRLQILRSILNPSEAFPPQYQAWEVETKDGEVHEGLQLDHKANGAIELLTLTGQVERFEGESVQDYRASKRSLMPDGLIDNLSVSEVRDLIAYLEGLK